MYNQFRVIFGIINNMQLYENIMIDHHYSSI